MFGKFFYMILMTRKIDKSGKKISELDTKVLPGHIEFGIANHFLGLNCPILITILLPLEILVKIVAPKNAIF